MKIMTKLCAALFLLVTASAYCEKENYKCLARNPQGACTIAEYYEDGYWVATCTAPANGSCTAVITRGKKTARCTKTGGTCYAKIKAPKND